MLNYRNWIYHFRICALLAVIILVILVFFFVLFIVHSRIIIFG
jgi:hypothetical protein